MTIFYQLWVIPSSSHSSQQCCAQKKDSFPPILLKIQHFRGVGPNTFATCRQTDNNENIAPQTSAFESRVCTSEFVLDKKFYLDGHSLQDSRGISFQDNPEKYCHKITDYRPMAGASS